MLTPAGTLEPEQLLKMVKMWGSNDPQGLNLWVDDRKRVYQLSGAINSIQHLVEIINDISKEPNVKSLASRALEEISECKPKKRDRRLRPRAT